MKNRYSFWTFQIWTALLQEFQEKIHLHLKIDLYLKIHPLQLNLIFLSLKHSFPQLSIPGWTIKLLFCIISTHSWRSSTRLMSSLVFSSGLRSSTYSDSSIMLEEVSSDLVVILLSMLSFVKHPLLVYFKSLLVEWYR